jgi:fatty acid/phospholipid biosynthesis enzyme
MEDHPAQAFRRKKDSSVHVGARLVKDRVADGLARARINERIEQELSLTQVKA